MEVVMEKRCQKLLVLMRKIIQAIDIHSKMLNKKFGLTGPQLIVLQEISSQVRISVTPLAKKTSLSQATVTDIAKRLESKGLIRKERIQGDKRLVLLSLSDQGKKVMENLPPLLQEQFVEKFSGLPNWEQMMILSSFERIVGLMAVRDLDVPNLLKTRPAQAMPKKSE